MVEIQQGNKKWLRHIITDYTHTACFNIMLIDSVFENTIQQNCEISWCLHCGKILTNTQMGTFDHGFQEMIYPFMWKQSSMILSYRHHQERTQNHENLESDHREMLLNIRRHKTGRQIHAKYLALSYKHNQMCNMYLTSINNGSLVDSRLYSPNNNTKIKSNYPVLAIDCPAGVRFDKWYQISAALDTNVDQEAPILPAKTTEKKLFIQIGVEKYKVEIEKQSTTLAIPYWTFRNYHRFDFVFWVHVEFTNNNEFLSLCTEGEIITTQSVKECRDEDPEQAPTKPKLLVHYNLSDVIDKPLSTGLKSCESTITIKSKHQKTDCQMYLYIRKIKNVLDPEYRKYSKHRTHTMGSKRYYYSHYDTPQSWQTAQKYCNDSGSTLFTVNSHEEYMSVLRACREKFFTVNVCSYPFVYIGLEVGLARNVFILKKDILQAI